MEKLVWRAIFLVVFTTFMVSVVMIAMWMVTPYHG